MESKEQSLEGASYQSMMSDIEQIIQKLSSGGVELDQMVEEVEKGYALIGKMRNKLSSVKLKIEDLKNQHQLDDKDQL